MPRSAEIPFCRVLPRSALGLRRGRVAKPSIHPERPGRSCEATLQDSAWQSALFCIHRNSDADRSHAGLVSANVAPAPLRLSGISLHYSGIFCGCRPAPLLPGRKLAHTSANPAFLLFSAIKIAQRPFCARPTPPIAGKGSSKFNRNIGIGNHDRTTDRAPTWVSNPKYWWRFTARCRGSTRSTRRSVPGLQAGRFQITYWPMTGQEAIPATLATLTDKNDYMVTIYRGIHDQVAKGVPLKGLFAEAMARKGGLNKGKGGAPHISDPDSGSMLTTAIVGGGHADCQWPGAGRQDARRRPGDHRQFRRRRDQHRRGARGDEPGGRVEAADHFHVPEQPDRRIHQDSRLYSEPGLCRPRGGLWLPRASSWTATIRRRSMPR